MSKYTQEQLDEVWNECAARSTGHTRTSDGLSAALLDARAENQRLYEQASRIRELQAALDAVCGQRDAIQAEWDVDRKELGDSLAVVAAARDRAYRSIDALQESLVGTRQQHDTSAREAREWKKWCESERAKLDKVREWAAIADLHAKPSTHQCFQAGYLGAMSALRTECLGMAAVAVFGAPETAEGAEPRRTPFETTHITGPWTGHIDGYPFTVPEGMRASFHVLKPAPKPSLVDRFSKLFGLYINGEQRAVREGIRAMEAHVAELERLHVATEGSSK